ncbi:DEAD/DEAH box helicase [Desulfococcus sp.]|uniref:DEAD/DEAH box helicase n=1 Tax=Desulfococcus sp. TaxID=2025834 RepID=UPI003593A9AA
MKISITSELILSEVPASIEEEIKGRLVFLNPKWSENERLGRWNRDTPKYVTAYEKTRTGNLVVPRGFVRQLLLMCRSRGVPCEIDDRRRAVEGAAFSFHGTLKPFQQQAAEGMLKREFGVLSAPTGSGKTVIALYMIAARGQPAIVVVHNRELAFQWIDRIKTFLGLPEEAIGLIGAGKKELGRPVTVALIQSLCKCVRDVAPLTGYLVVDECHRTPSRTFTEAVSAFDARFMLGLTATPWRRDRLSRLIFWYLGDVHHAIDAAALVAGGHILAADVVIRETAFSPYHDAVREYSRMLSELTADDGRNRLIAADVAAEVRAGQGVCLVLSDRKKHCETLQALLRYGYKTDSVLLTGDVSPRERRDVLARIGAGGVRVLVATGQLIGEGFDCRDLATLFIATPVRFSGRLLQYLGRVLRPAPGKTRARVYDYVDAAVGPLVSAAHARQRVYAGGDSGERQEGGTSSAAEPSRISWGLNRDL